MESKRRLAGRYADMLKANDELRDENRELRRIVDFLMDEFHPNPKAYLSMSLFGRIYNYRLLADDIKFEKEQREAYEAFQRMYGTTEEEEEPRGLRLVEDNT